MHANLCFHRTNHTDTICNGCEFRKEISDLKIGDSLRVADLSVDGCTIPLNESAVVLGIRRTRAAMSAEAEEVEGEGEATEESAAEE